MDLITEAKKRGYRTGTKIFYGHHTTGDFELDCDVLGCGEFAIDDNGDVIKYEQDNPGSNWRRYDTIYIASKKEWVKIVK